MALLTFGVCLPAQAQVADGREPGQRRIALVGGALIDGSGSAVVPNSVVLVRGDRIEAVGTVGSLAVPEGYERLSTEGMTVLPGLWDMHTHLQYSAHADLTAWNNKYLPVMESVIMPALAEQLLMAGITSAREPMAPLDAIVRVRERIAAGELLGPTLYVAGALLEHEAPPGTEAFRWSTTGIDDAVGKVDRLADAGVDLVKLLCVPEMPVAVATAIVERAHRHGLMVAAHGRSDDEIRKCLAAGVDDFQHLGTAALLPDDILHSIRERTAAGTLYWTPTVGVAINYAHLRRNPEMLDDPAWQRGLPQPIVADVAESLSGFDSLYDRLSFLTAEDESMYRQKFWQLIGAGAQLLVGTDSGNPGHFHTFGLWVELDTWVNRFGVDAMEAIRRVTSLPAQVMRVDQDYGTVEPGKYADIVAVRGDPLRHIDVLREPALVMKHGQRVK
jgi:imidazolonepropionase-like amidohydrolase